MLVKLAITLFIICVNALGVAFVVFGFSRLDDERRGFLCFGFVSLLCSWAFTGIFLIGGILL